MKLSNNYDLWIMVFLSGQLNDLIFFKNTINDNGQYDDGFESLSLYEKDDILLYYELKL